MEKRAMTTSALGRILAASIVLGVAAAGASPPDSTATAAAAAIGSHELGASLSASSIEGNASVMIVARSGWFFPMLGQTFSGEPSVGYTYIQSLSILDVQGNLIWHPWQPRLVPDGVSWFISAGGGLRQEWLGSFSQARYPFGAGAGLRVHFNPFAAIRMEYLYRRILGDPVEEFDEHHLLIGFSIFPGFSG